MISDLIASSRKLTKIAPEAAEAYVHAVDRLVDFVNNQLESNLGISELIGGNPLELMRNNHQNHAAFMSTVFRVNSFDLLTRTIPWVYRAYHARGFSYAYFPAELVAWQIAIHGCLDQSVQKQEMLAVYEWMVLHHDEFIELSIAGEGLSFSVQNEASEMQQIFLSLLLHGDRHGCLKLVEQSVQNADDLKRFYLDVAWPAMCSVGYLWESNQISVAEEHLATAIVGRVMAALYPKFSLFEISRGTAVISAGPNELHELGARMVADFMEMDGWDVTYLGANTPAIYFFDLLKRNKPFMAAISVATVFNIDNAQQLIKMVREDAETRGIKIMVGGLAFNAVPQLWQEIGADGYAADAEEATSVSNDWWANRDSICA